MKKFVFTFALLVITQLSFAQDGFKADMKKYMTLSGQISTFELLTKDLVKNIPESNQAAFSKDLKVSLDVLMDKMAEMYMTEFTHEDVKAMIEFYETPAGKKLSEKNGVLFEKGQLIGQEWGMGLQGIMMKYME